MRIMIIMNLVGLLFLAGCSAAQQKYDVARGAPVIAPGEGLLIGKVQNVGLTGGSPISWTPIWKRLLGMPMVYGIVVDGELSQYSATSDGFFIIRYPAGELKDLQFYYSESTGRAATAGPITVTASGGFVQPLLEKGSIKIESGKTIVLPVISIQWTARGEVILTREQTVEKREEVIGWFKTTFPGLINEFPLK